MSRRAKPKAKVTPDSGLDSKATPQELPHHNILPLPGKEVKWNDRPYESEFESTEMEGDPEDPELSSQPPSWAEDRPISPSPSQQQTVSMTDFTSMMAQMMQMQMKRDEARQQERDDDRKECKQEREEETKRVRKIDDELR